MSNPTTGGFTLIKYGTKICPYCGGILSNYDRVTRIIRTKYRETKKVYIRRKICKSCGHIQRELRRDMLPFKQYEKEVILGVLEGLITPSTYGFEDYPNELTMTRWIKEFGSKLPTDFVLSKSNC